MLDTLNLEGNYYILFLYAFCRNPGQRLPEVSGLYTVGAGVRPAPPDLNPRPSDLQPDAMTIRPRQP